MACSNACQFTATLDPSCAYGGLDDWAFPVLGHRMLAPQCWHRRLVLAGLSAEEQLAREEIEGWPKSRLLGTAPV